MKTVQSIEQNEIRFYDSLYADIWQQYPDLVVTESMAELLLQQGHPAEALLVYRHLETRGMGEGRFHRRSPSSSEPLPRLRLRPRPRRNPRGRPTRRLPPLPLRRFLPFRWRSPAASRCRHFSRASSPPGSRPWRRRLRCRPNGRAATRQETPRARPPGRRMTACR